jgi:formate dehydrogenase iron-sulfur subunit
MVFCSSTRPRSEKSRGLIEQLLDEQQLLTPVADFARKHERGEVGGGFGNYRELLPLTPPAPGEQYAFEVVLDKCSGCKACVTACHSLNGLDDNETWRDVGVLISEPQRRVGGTNSASPNSFSALQQPGTHGNRPSTMQHVTSACHHCVDPACLNGCPVAAYEKNDVTGIVRHLDDQCIGCQYCVLKCPYDVPKYNERLGIVRKCDMCASRLAVDEAPACVQACPNEAIRITKVQTEAVRIEFRERGGEFLSGAPAGDYTLPTTRYVLADEANGNGDDQIGRATENSADRAPGASLIAADAAALRPQPAHWPLVFMLVLSQASVGATCAAVFARQNVFMLLFALALGVAGIAAGVLHLGRPLGAWRFFLGLRRSWLSREILVFSLFIPTVAFLAGSAFLSPHPGPLPRGEGPTRSAVARELRTLSNGAPGQDTTRQTVLPLPKGEGRGEGKGIPGNPATFIVPVAVSLLGLLGVFCSMMIYHDTQRTLWNWRRSAPLFFGTMALLGLSAALIANSSSGALSAILVVAVVAKLAVEVSVLRHVRDRDLTSLKKTALLVTGLFQPIAFVRLACLMAGGIGLPLLLKTGAFAFAPVVIGSCAFALLIAGELLERLLFFRVVDAPKMPGGFAA